jgi:hypothetical protein
MLKDIISIFPLNTPDKGKLLSVWSAGTSPPRAPFFLQRIDRVIMNLYRFKRDYIFNFTGSEMFRKLVILKKKGFYYQKR